MMYPHSDSNVCMHVLRQYSLDTLQKFGCHHNQNYRSMQAMLCPHMLGYTDYVSQFPFCLMVLDFRQ